MTSRRFPPDLSDTTPLEAGDAARHRSAVGSGIYFSADRRDIQYAVTELVRHMAMPRRCDMNQAMMLGRYLQQRPSLVRVTTSLGRFLRQRLGRMRRNQKVYRLPRSRPRWGGGDHFDTDAARTAGNEQPRRRAKRHKPSLCLGLWPRSRGRGPEDMVGQLRQHHRCKAYWAGNQAPPRGRFGVLRPRGSLVSASREGPAEKGERHGKPGELPYETPTWSREPPPRRGIR